MIRHLLRKFAWRRAAHAYARRLGPQLAGDYGASECYTAPQIQASAARAGLPSRYLAFGFAAYMSESEFPGQPAGDLHVTRDELRAALDRFSLSSPSAAFQPAGESFNAQAGANFSL